MHLRDLGAGGLVFDRRLGQSCSVKVDRASRRELWASAAPHPWKGSSASIARDLFMKSSAEKLRIGGSQICEARAWSSPAKMGFTEAVQVVMQLSRGTELEAKFYGVSITPRSFERGGHDQLVLQLLMHLRGKLDKLDAGLLVCLAQALAAMKCHPPEHWCCELLDAVEVHMLELSPRQITYCFSAFSSLRVLPPKPWVDKAMRQVLLPSGLNQLELCTTDLDGGHMHSQVDPSASTAWRCEQVSPGDTVPRYLAQPSCCLNAQEHVALMQALASMGMAPFQPVLSSLEMLSVPLLAHMPLPTLTKLSEAYSKLEHRLGRAWLQALAAAASPMLDSAAPKEVGAFVVAISNMLGGEALNHLGPDLTDKLWTRTAALMADGSLLMGSFVEMMSAVGKLHAHRHMPAPNYWLALSVANAGRLAPSMQPYHLCSLLHSMARMRLTCTPSDAQHALASRFLELMPNLGPNHLSKVSGSLARLKLVHAMPSLAQAYSSQVCSFDLTSLRPDVLSNLLYGMAALRAKVGFKQQLTLLGATYAVMRKANAQDMCSTISSLARMGFRPDAAWSERILLEVRRRLPKSSAAHLACMSWGLASMGINPSSQWIDMMATEAAGKLCCCSPKHLSHLIWSFSKWGYSPSQHWMDHFHAVTLTQLRTSDAHSLSVIVTAFSNMAPQAQPPKSWMEAFCIAFMQRAHLSSPHSLTGTMRALARLSYSPGQAWMLRTAELLHESSTFAHGAPENKPNLQDLAHAVWALDQMGFQASPDWLSRHAELTVEAARLQITSVHHRLLVEQQHLHPEKDARDEAQQDGQQQQIEQLQQSHRGVVWEPASPEVGLELAKNSTSALSSQVFGSEVAAANMTVGSRAAVANLAAAAVRHAASSAVSKHVASSLLSLSNIGYQVCTGSRVQQHKLDPTAVDEPVARLMPAMCGTEHRSQLSNLVQATTENRATESTSTCTKLLIRPLHTMLAVPKKTMSAEAFYSPLLSLGINLVPVAAPSSLASLALMFGRQKVALGRPAMKVFLETSLSRLPTMTGRELLLLSWGLSRLAVKPGSEWFDRFQFTVFQRCQGVGASGREDAVETELSTEQRLGLLRVAARSRWALHPRLLGSLLPRVDDLMELSSAIRGSLHHGAQDVGGETTMLPRTPLGAAHLATMAWSLARLRVLPNEAWAMAFLSACGACFCAERLSAGTVAKLSWSLASLWVLPPIDWTLELMDSAARLAPNMNSRALADTLWACARLVHPAGVRGHSRKRLIRPHLHRTKPHLALLAAQAEKLLCSGKLQGRSLLITLWALARLQVQVSSTFRRAASRAAVGALPHARPQMLLLSVWALERLQVPVSRTFISWLQNVVEGSLVAVGGTSLMHMYFGMMSKMERRCRWKEARCWESFRRGAAVRRVSAGKRWQRSPPGMTLRRGLRTLGHAWARKRRGHQPHADL